MALHKKINELLPRVTDSTVLPELYCIEAELCDTKDELEASLSDRNVTDEHGSRLSSKDYWAHRKFIISEIAATQQKLRWLRLLIREMEERP